MTSNENKADFEASEAATRVLRIASAVAQSEWPADPTERIELLRDVQRICAATEHRIENLIVIVEVEIERQGRDKE